MARAIENLPAMQEMQETQDQLLGQEDPWKEEMITNSSILPGEFRGQRGRMGYSPWDLNVSDVTEHMTDYYQNWNKF